MNPQAITYTFYHRSDKENTPTPGTRILVFAPDYPENDPMRMQVIDSRCWDMCYDADFWAYTTEPAFDVPGKV